MFKLSTDQGLENRINSAKDLYVKFATMLPDDHTTREELQNMLFILSEYMDGARSEQRRRKRTRLESRRNK